MTHTPRPVPARSAPRTCSVVVCAYSDERWDLLQAAVEGALGQRQQAEIVVVIDHNSALLARARVAWTGVKVVANEQQRGLSGARNTGVRHASGEVVAFLDDDARPRAGWLDALLQPYDDPRVVGTAGLAIPSWEGSAPAWLPAEFLWTVGCSYRGLPADGATIRNPIGANMSFRHEIFERVGGFNAQIGRMGKLPLGCEETELAIRVQAAIPDTVLVHVHGACVEHQVPVQRASWSYFRSRCFAEGQSKALVAAAVGFDSGLSSERAYTVSVLPRGVVRGLREAIMGDASGVLRASAIVAGLAITAAGYLRGKLALLTSRASRIASERQ